MGIVEEGLHGCEQVVSYHTHIPHYIPQYTWDGLVEPMWKVIRFCTLMADLTLVPSNMMKVPPPPSFSWEGFMPFLLQSPKCLDLQSMKDGTSEHHVTICRLH